MRAQIKLTVTRLSSASLRLLLLSAVIATPLFSLLSNFDAFEPYLFPLHYLQGNVRSVSDNVLVGHYPDYGLLSELDHRGVKIVISLLNDKLIYEEPLIQREVAYSKQLGMTDLNFKMDSEQPPNSPLNSAAIANIKRIIAANPHSKIYIHCYFGRHRTGYVVKQLHATAGHLMLAAKNDG